MRNLFLIITFVIAASCQAQQLVKISDELKTLEVNQEKYVGKPLSILLKDIKTEIKYVIGAPGEGVRRSALIFSFVPLNEREKFRKKGKYPPSLIVYLKEDFEWDRAHLEKYNRNDWSKDDVIKFGNLTVYKIAAIHENETLE